MMRERSTATIRTGESPNVMGPLHALLRAPYSARGFVTIDHRCGAGEVVVDIAFGETGAEREVLCVDQRGAFAIPQGIPQGSLVSIRCQGSRPGVPVTVTLELERDDQR